MSLFPNEYLFLFIKESFKGLLLLILLFILLLFFTSLSSKLLLSLSSFNDDSKNDLRLSFLLSLSLDSSSDICLSCFSSILDSSFFFIFSSLFKYLSHISFTSLKHQSNITSFLLKLKLIITNPNNLPNNPFKYL